MKGRNFIGSTGTVGLLHQRGWKTLMNHYTRKPFYIQTRESCHCAPGENLKSNMKPSRLTEFSRTRKSAQKRKREREKERWVDVSRSKTPPESRISTCRNRKMDSIYFFNGKSAENSIGEYPVAGCLRRSFKIMENKHFFETSCP